MRTKIGIALLAAILLALGGCSNKSTNPDDAEIPYALRTTPGGVITKLMESYRAMDAEAYLDCLAEDFEFFLDPDDLNDPENPLPHSWGKQVESQIHEAMFSDTTNVDKVRLTLTTITTFFDAGADPNSQSDDRYTYVDGTDLSVWIGEWQYVATANQQFVFRVDPDDTGPDGETLWEIISWYELQSGRGEHSSWGSIKSLYR